VRLDVADAGVHQLATSEIQPGDRNGGTARAHQRRVASA
jgi:hypothetical protein